ncbi:hypothetical protein SUGI_1080100 [Cryptomeria japonica]|nr:hypothetical protein SUGI_1080100 [Cryptomeria japonica]
MYPIVFWKSLYKMVNIAISNLSMKLLIKIDDKGVLDMHDHLRDMGRTIAEKEGTRVWKAAHLSSASDNTNFSRIRLNGGNSQRPEMLYRPGLRYLHLQCVPIEGMTEDTLAGLPPSLIWLRLEHRPFATGKKTALSRFGCNIWQLSKKGMEKPDRSRFVGNIAQLRNLKILPDAIGNLLQLQQLDLRWCERIKILPDTISSLSQLQQLDLRWCRILSNLRDTIINLSQLQHLDLSFLEEA